MGHLSPWRSELWLVVLASAALLIIGQTHDLGLLPLAVGGLAYLVWHAYNLARLLRWLSREGRTPPPDPFGVWGFVFYRVDVRERRSRERKRKLGKRLKRLNQSVRALPYALLELNDRFEIQWSNPAAKKLLALHGEDTGQSIANLVRAPEFTRYLQQRNFNQPVTVDATLDRAALALRAVPYGKRAFLLTARDITAQRRSEQLQRDFVANASHELRTPLTVLSGSIEQLRMQASEDPAWARPLGWMERQTERMTRIVEDLLLLARLERARDASEAGEPVDLSGLARACVDEATELSRREGGHAIDARIESGVRIVGFVDELRAALANLLVKAVRYTPAGGAIEIRLATTGDGVRFSVKDSGPGIPAAHHARLTERFYRVDAGRSREAGGTGLGLAIVKHVLDRYGAKLAIDSAPGRGSTFGFVIGADYRVDTARAS